VVFFLVGMIEPEVVTKAVQTHHVVANNSFAAKQKARSVVQHANPAAQGNRSWKINGWD
jgi:hypothetical protein